MTLARQWRGQERFEEVWFLQALIGPDRGLWLRWVIDATAGEAQVWALVSTRDGGLEAHRETVPLASLGGALFAAGPGRLERDVAVGRCGPVSWDLRLDDRGLRHAHVPLWVRGLGIGRTYAPAALDLRVAGTVSVGDQTFAVDRAPGVLGHLWGAGSKVTRWAWAHCNAFDREDLVFEGLAAQIGGVWLTSLVLHADGHAYPFSRTRDLLRTSTSTNPTSWSFEAKRAGIELTGHVALVPERAARVRYVGHRASDVLCTNTRFGSIRLILRDPAHGIDLDLKSRECAFELAIPVEGDPGFAGWVAGRGPV